MEAGNASPVSEIPDRHSADDRRELAVTLETSNKGCLKREDCFSTKLFSEELIMCIPAKKRLEEQMLAFK